MDDEHPTFFTWLDYGHPSDFMFTQEQLNDWDEAHLMMCHWYIEMDPNYIPRHEEEHRKSVELAYVQPQPAVAIECERENSTTSPMAISNYTKLF